MTDRNLESTYFYNYNKWPTPLFSAFQMFCSVQILFYNQNKTIKIVFSTVGLGLTLVCLPQYIHIHIIYVQLLFKRMYIIFFPRELIEELHPIIKEALERRPEVNCV